MIDGAHDLPTGHDPLFIIPSSQPLVGISGNLGLAKGFPNIRPPTKTSPDHIGPAIVREIVCADRMIAMSFSSKPCTSCNHDGKNCM